MKVLKIVSDVLVGLGTGIIIVLALNAMALSAVVTLQVLLQ